MNIILLIGALLGLSSVGMGAYVDHVLSHVVDVKTLTMLKTALLYHQLYAVIIAALGLYLANQKNHILIKLSAWLFILGSCTFSFSIYLASITNNMTYIKITPTGGVTLMLAWVLLACGAMNPQRRRSDP